MLKEIHLMAITKSLDPYYGISAALLRDIQKSHSNVMSDSALRATSARISTRVAEEGLGFYTKTLPRLAKRLDECLASTTIQFDASDLRFKTQDGSKIPLFMGELFGEVIDKVGRPLAQPCVKCIRSLRQYFYAFYKLELPYSPELEQEVLDLFVKTDRELASFNNLFDELRQETTTDYHFSKRRERVNNTITYQRGVTHKLVRACFGRWTERNEVPSLDERVTLSEAIRESETVLKSARATLRGLNVLRRARYLLHRLFRGFDPKDIVPAHGPGSVSTGERLHEKYSWTNVNEGIASVYPIDEFYFVNLEHVSDRLKTLTGIGSKVNLAKVILVPKDSRGPRLISCEPLENQWIQQGLSQAVVKHVEKHRLTSHAVHFTDQGPNRRAAILGSKSGNYATLDLKEASDRLVLGLVRLLYPAPLVEAMEACRTQATKLPDGSIVKLEKFAPMGSALCFPILALTVWAILQAGLTDDAQVDEDVSLLVYGDDVVVKTAQAADAIQLLEAFGFLVNRPKSCLSGFFRESCGMDAYQGEQVTPVRIRTVWASDPCPSAYASYCSYANEFYSRGYYNTHEYIVRCLYEDYGPLTASEWDLPVPSIVELPEKYRAWKVRSHKGLQKLQRKVLSLRSKSEVKTIDGWSMLLRYFTQKVGYVKQPAIDDKGLTTNDTPRRCGVPATNDGLNELVRPSFSAESYTDRNAVSLAYRWH